MSDAFNSQQERGVDNKDYFLSQKQELKETLALLDQYYDKWAEIQEEISNISGNSSTDELSGNLYFQELIGESDKLNEQMAYLEDKAQSLNMELHESGESISIWDSIKMAMSQVGDTMKGILNDSIQLPGKWRLVQKAIQGCATGISVLGSGIMKGASGFRNLILLVGKSKKDIGDMANSSIGMFKKMGFALLGVRSVFMAIRKVFSQVKAENQEIGLQVDAIWKGIATAITPIVKTIMNYVGILMGYINSIYKVFTGKDLFKATSKSAKSTADSTKKTAKNVKEIKNQLASFDEMNVLSDSSNKDSSGNDGSGGATYTAPVTADMSEFAKKIKEAIENEDWKAVGQLIGGKINEAIEMIDYNKVGHTLGKGLNGAIQIAYFTLDTINFNMIGKHLSETLNGIMSEVDFSYLGRLLAKWVTIIPDILIGAINELDFGLVAKSVSGYFIGVFDEFGKFILKTDWGNLADNMYKGFKDLLANIDYVGLAKSFFTLLGGALGGSVRFIWEILKGIGEDIMNGSFEGILDAIKGVPKWVYDNIWTPFVDAFKKAFGIASPSKKMKEQGGFIVDGLLEGIKDIPSKVKKKFSDAVEEIKKAFKNMPKYFSDLWESIKKKFSKLGTTIGDAIGSSVKKGINGIISLIEKTMNKAIGLINGGIDLINKIPGVKVKKVGELSLPRLATGTVVNRPTQAIIGESGAEAVVPLQNNLQWLDKLASMLNDRLDGGGNGGTHTTIVNLDGKVLLRSVNKAQKNQTLVLNGG